MPKTTKKKGKGKKKSSQKKGPCWTGYHKVKGKANFSKGSCAKNGKKK